MKVIVVCLNDYPDAVFATERLALAYIEGRKESERKEGTRMFRHWHYYEYEVVGS